MLARMAKKTTAKRTTKVAKARPAKAPVPAGTPDPDRCAAALSEIGVFCRGLPGATVDIKWEDNLMFSIGGKIFAGMQCDDAGSVGFKCDDVEFERLTKVEGVIPAPYAARFGWVKVVRAGALKRAQLEKHLRRSYELVRAGLPAKVRAGLPPA
jgi:predicted DNA-binding protein (MmcQ/YjbR family)